MTSNLRSYAALTVRSVKPVMITSAYYTDADNNEHLFPFTYNNGTLDLFLRDSSFQELYIDTTGQKPDNMGTNAGYMYLLRGGAGLVTALGPNFVKYIRAAWELSASTPVRIQQKCLVTKVQEMYDPDQGDSIANSGYYESPNPPVNDEYLTPGPQYRTPWIFKTPLTIEITNGGVKSYITFTSLIGRDSA